MTGLSLAINMALRLSYPVADPIVTQPFGNKLIILGEDVYAQWGYPGHNGIDFRAEMGTEVLACDDGKIVATPNDPEGFGTYVKIKHEWGISYYCHLSRKKSPKAVMRGDVIGYSGDSGFSTAPHLHFGLKVTNAVCPGYKGWSDPTLFL